MRISSSLFEGLCRVDENGEPQPGMAESWDMSSDALSYTFYLRQGILWSDGSPVTARDFVASWKRTLTPATAADYASQFYVIKGAREFNEGTLTDFSQVGVKALDERTLQVELVNPVPYFIDLCAFVTLAPVPVEKIEKLGTTWIKPTHIVCNGPYILKDWRVDDRVLLERNPLYWDAANVKMRTVEVKPVTDANTALNFFHSQLCDLLMDKGMVPPSLTGPLKKQPYFHTGPFLGSWFIRFNVTKAPFNDVRVRRAFALVVDKKRITQKITNLGEQVSEGIVPAGAGQNYQPPKGLGLDIATAQKLLAQAGYPGGKGFPTVDYLHLPLPLERNIAIELKSMWETALGVTISLSKQEQKAWVASMRELNYQMCRSSWVGDYNDPNTFLELFISGNGQNHTGWSDSRYDHLIAQAAAERDATKRNLLFQQAEQLLVSEGAALVPVYTYVGVQFFRSDRLGGVKSNLIDEHPFRCMYWK